MALISLSVTNDSCTLFQPSTWPCTNQRRSRALCTRISLVTTRTSRRTATSTACAVRRRRSTTKRTRWGIKNLRERRLIGGEWIYWRRTEFTPWNYSFQRLRRRPLSKVKLFKVRVGQRWPPTSAVNTQNIPLSPPRIVRRFSFEGGRGKTYKCYKIKDDFIVGGP